MTTENRSYKEYNTDYIGASDMARLIADSPNGVNYIKFMEDGSYNAYIVDGEAQIGEHYNSVFECDGWLKIYDDEGLVREFLGDKIKIYRSGDFGCIIQIVNRKYQHHNGGVFDYPEND